MGVRDEAWPKVVQLQKLVDESAVEAVADFLLKSILPIFMEEQQLKTYARILQGRLSRDEGRQDVLRFARSLVCDCNIGMQANDMERTYDGEIAFYHSRADETWPPSIDGLYENLPNLWESYTSGKF